MRISIEGVIGEIDSLPGCSQIAVSHAVFLPKEHRGKGVGKKAHAARLEELRKLGYDYVLCTVNGENEKQLHILKDAHWSFLALFTSAKTEHLVQLWGRRL